MHEAFWLQAQLLYSSTKQCKFLCIVLISYDLKEYPGLIIKYFSSFARTLGILSAACFPHKLTVFIKRGHTSVAYSCNLLLIQYSIYVSLIYLLLSIICRPFFSSRRSLPCDKEQKFFCCKHLYCVLVRVFH